MDVECFCVETRRLVEPGAAAKRAPFLSADPSEFIFFSQDVNRALICTGAALPLALLRLQVQLDPPLAVVDASWWFLCCADGAVQFAMVLQLLPPVN